MLRTLLVLGLCVAGLPLLTLADDAKEGTDKVVHSKIADAKSTCGSACQVNFAKELGVSLDYLGTIGHRISVARKAADPVDLALLAQSLSVAEQVSGKKASITAEQIRKEALELAKLRGYSAELAAIALVIPEAKADLEKLTVIAKKREAEGKKQTESDEVQKALLGTLTVINHSGECLRIFVSGRYVGTAHEGTTSYFRVHDHNEPSHLDAYCEEDGDLVSEQNVFGHVHNFTWHIH